MNHYNHRAVSPNCYIITEDYGPESRYTIGLFVGSHSGAVIDSGWGLTGNLRNYIESNITQKPLICLLTHPHPDHMGASTQFDRVYMNPLDEKISLSSRTLEKRLGDMKAKFGESPLYLEMEAEASDCSGFDYVPLTDGDSFDLGELTVNAMSVPGHTEGSMVFYSMEENIAFVGDTIGSRVMFLGEGSDIGAYIHHIRRFADAAGAQIRMFSGHSQQPMEKQLLEDVVGACENVLSGNNNPVRAELPPFILAGLGGATPLAERKGSATVVYI